MFKSLAYQDFDRAYRRAFWRKIRAWLTGTSNELLPYDEVRQQLPFSGQRDLGMQTIPLDKIVGSVGRYRDFDRIFLPTQRETTQRWVSIKAAHYEEKILPPIEAYKIGDVYFVRDGNHRVSVAREREQAFIDAYVIEIDAPIKLTPDTKIDDLVQQRDYAQFMAQTGLIRLRPDANLELTAAGEYGRLLNHIQTHQYYLGLEEQRDIPWDEAVTSWYDNVYLPLVTLILEHDLDRAFPNNTVTDLYWWVSEYQWLLREAYVGEKGMATAVAKLAEMYTDKAVRQVIRKLRQATWIDAMLLEQERDHFLEYTKIKEIRPEADVTLSLPGKYDKLLYHISAHRWYLGEERGGDVPYEEAVASWYDNAYLPLVEMIREQGIMQSFPDRTEADLYLWLVDHRQEFVESFTDEGE
ncbi:MAG: hypothetical protein H6667_11535 [Ardenticatenaceae bacterium]|nr:hypothetical protein [Ardenticatenaceae bacterium]